MKDFEHSANYRKSLIDSYDLNSNILNELYNIIKERQDSNNNTDNKNISNELRNKLNDLQYQMIFDTVQLIQKKNLFKNEYYKINEELTKKIKTNDSSATNSFLLKLDIQNFKNNKQWSLLNESILKLPELQINNLIDFNNDNNDNKFIKSLNLSLDDIKSLLLDNNQINEIDKDKFIIPEESNLKLQKFLEDSDIKKFRLVQLHDNYYERKINMLKEMDRKWKFEINKIKNFVSLDINKMKNELNNKLNELNESKKETELDNDERDNLELNQVNNDIIDYEYSDVITKKEINRDNEVETENEEDLQNHSELDEIEHDSNIEESNDNIETDEMEDEKDMEVEDKVEEDNEAAEIEE